VAVYYADSSALAKRYVLETGTAWLRSLLDPATGNVAVIARITAVELIAAFTRRERGGALDPADAATARADFRTHLTHEYQVVEVTEARANQAMLLAETYGLRGYDAVQLAAAMDVNREFLVRGEPSITLISSDTELNAAAAAEGLTIEDPNTHP
jgi:predicted nucleic acid-binding protein